MKKILSLIISAIAFGLIAGIVFVSLNYVANDAGLVDNLPPFLKNLGKNENIVESTISEIKQEVETKIEKKKEETAINNYVIEGSIDVSKIAENAMPSVVSITNMQKFTSNGFSMFGFRQQPQQYEAPASGSGIIVENTADEIVIITNNHVVQDSTSLSVTFKDKETIDAAIKGTDSSKDLAIISVKKEDIRKKDANLLNEIKVAKIGDSDKIKVGEQVVAIGNALGIGQSVTTGIISAKDRIIDSIDNSEKLIQTDAAINPGNSGGALMNMGGEVIGINVAKSSGNAVEGMGYAIPINTATEVIKTLSTRKNREKIPEDEQGYLGILAKNIDSQTAESLNMPEGVYVYKITENSAAANSELREKDIIISFDDQSVKTQSELVELVSYTRKGQVVKMKVKRLENGEYVEKEFNVTLGAKEKTETENKQETTTNDQKQEQNGQGQNGQGQFYDPFQDFDRYFNDFPFGNMW